MTEYMNQTLEEMEAAFLDGLPLKRRLRGVSVGEVLKQYSPEEWLRGLSEEDRARLRTLLDDKPSAE